MNNFLKHNLEMPLTGGITGGGSGGSEPSDILDTYKQGDIFATTRELNNQEFREVLDGDMITIDGDPSLYTFFESKISDQKTTRILTTKKENFNPFENGATSGEFVFSIPFNDFKYFLFASSNDFEISTEYFIIEHDKNGNNIGSTLRNDGPVLKFGDPAETPINISYDIKYIKSINKTILYLKHNLDLFVFIHDYFDDSEYGISLTNYFIAKESKVKVTQKAVYEFDIATKIIYRYNLPSDNVNIPTSRTTVISKNDLVNAGFLGTFSGELNSNFYAWGEDVNIFTYTTTDEDLFIFSDKTTTNNSTNFYSSPIPSSSPNGGTIASNATMFSYQSILFVNNITGEPNEEYILNSNDTNIVYEKNVILQANENRIWIGTLCQNNSSGDFLVSNDSNEQGEYVFNDLYIEKTDPKFSGFSGDGSGFIEDFYFIAGIQDFVSSDENLKFSYLNGELAFDLYSISPDSLSIILYKKDFSNPTGTGTINYLQNSKILTISKLTNGLFEPYIPGQPPFFSVFPLNSIKVLYGDLGLGSLSRVFYSYGFYGIVISYIYQSLISKTEVKGYDDTLSRTMTKEINELKSSTIYYTQKGYSFDKISNQPYVKTYIKK